MKKVYILREDGAVAAVYTNLRQAMQAVKDRADHAWWGGQPLGWGEVAQILSNTETVDDEERQLPFGFEELIECDMGYTIQARIANEYTEPPEIETRAGIIYGYVNAGRNLARDKRNADPFKLN